MERTNLQSSFKVTAHLRRALSLPFDLLFKLDWISRRSTMFFLHCAFQSVVEEAWLFTVLPNKLVCTVRHTEESRMILWNCLQVRSKDDSCWHGCFDSRIQWEKIGSNISCGQDWKNDIVVLVWKTAVGNQSNLNKKRDVGLWSWWGSLMNASYIRQHH